MEKFLLDLKEARDILLNGDFATGIARLENLIEEVENDTENS
jgi:hypothetical protein